MDELKEKALKIRDLYNQLQDRNNKPRWNYKEHTEGLVGDASDLLKLIMAKDGLRSADTNLNEELGHELSDCLWCLFVIADELDINIEEAFKHNINDLESRIKNHLNH